MHIATNDPGTYQYIALPAGKILVVQAYRNPNEQDRLSFIFRVVDLNDLAWGYTAISNV